MKVSGAAQIANFLQCRRIAVVGVSRSHGFGNTVLTTLSERGYDVVPVNANADSIAGRPCYRGLVHIKPPVDAVVVVVPPSQTEAVVDDCITLGIRHLWMQQGAQSDAAIQRAASAGISLVHHKCILMYASPRGVHRLHRWLHDCLTRQTATAASP